jgi:DNA modification methylase
MKALNQNVTSTHAIYQGDSCELIKALPNESVHYGIHSPPFEGLYKFTNSDLRIFDPRYSPHHKAGPIAQRPRNATARHQRT